MKPADVLAAIVPWLSDTLSGVLHPRVWIGIAAGQLTAPQERLTLGEGAARRILPGTCPSQRLQARRKARASL